jgi:tRNA pseudouridine55 synthase
MNGLLVIDKPGGMTSRDVVNRVQRWFPRGTKVGHTGTLDPLATGVLVVCVGAATRLADYVQMMGKGYASRFRLGATSTTDDADGDVTETPAAVPPTRGQVEVALAGFVGVIGQMPPAFSALKVSGRRAHELARSGEDVRLAPRTVRIDAVRLVGYEWPFADVQVDCGKGTYIRSVARDVGAKLGVGGLVQTLRRTRVGPFTAEQGVGVDVTPEAGRTAVLPPLSAFPAWPRVALSAAGEARFRSGQVVGYERADELDGGVIAAVLGPDGEMVGIGEALRGKRVAPEVVLGR